MTVPSTPRSAGPFLGNGVTTSFPFAFRVFAADDIAVRRTAPNGARATLVLGSDYSVTLNLDQNASPGGHITYPLSGPALAVGWKLDVLGALPYDQPYSPTPGGRFAPTSVENALDRAVIQIQQLADATARAIRLPVGSYPADLGGDFAGRCLGFDSLGNPVAVDCGGGGGGGGGPPGSSPTYTELASVAVGEGAELVGFDGSREQAAGTVGAKLHETVSVKDHGAVGDGVADDTAAVTAAVAHAMLHGGTLYWPPGAYRTTASVAGLHSVGHRGAGASVVRGADVFHIEPTDQTNIIYVATDGNNGNDGLSASQPKLTGQSAVDALSAVWRAAMAVGGHWQVSLAAGTYARIRLPDEGLRSRHPIRFVGADVGGHPNVPTTLIKEGPTEAAVGLFAPRMTNVYVQDIKFEDFNGSTASAGVYVANRSNLESVNCHYEDCLSGITGMEWCELDVKGGVFNDCGYLNSVTNSGWAVRGLFHCKLSIGTQGAGTLSYGPVFTNNYIAVLAQEMTTGHVDWCTFTGNGTALRLSVASRANFGGSSFTNNGTAVFATDNSIASPVSSSVYSGNNQNIVLGGGSNCSSAGPITGVSGGFAQGSQVVWGSKAQQVVSTLSATVVKSATLIGGMLRETLSSTTQPKRIGFRMCGSINGTTGSKTIQLRFGASVAVGLLFSASETGDFVASGELILRGVGSQALWLKGTWHTGITRVDTAAKSEALSADTAFQLEALVGASGSDVTFEYVELYTAGM